MSRDEMAVISQLPEFLFLIGKDHSGGAFAISNLYLVASVLLWYNQHLMCYKGQRELLA